MITNGQRVVWSEGLFLRPQHFQQQDRFLEHQFLKRFALLENHGYGLTELDIDSHSLGLNSLVLKASGIMPDGTAFMIPGDEGSLLTLSIPPGVENELIYLTLPYEHSGRTLAPSREAAEYERFYTAEIKVTDMAGEEDPLNLCVASPNLRLKLASEPQDNAVSLPIARVLRSAEASGTILDAAFIPPVLHIATHPSLQAALKEVSVLLHQRRRKLLDRIGAIDNYGVAGMTELLLLQLINRYEPLFIHLQNERRVHPERLYTLLLQLTGELRTFTSEDRSYNQPPPYQHSHLQETFTELMQDLRQAFNYIFDEPAIRLSCEHVKYGLFMTTFPDREALKHYLRLVLAVKADLPLEELRNRFPAHTKVGSPETIKELVNHQLPGIPLQLLPVAPRQIPYYQGYLYFELDNHAEKWLQVKTAAGIAIHVGGQFHNLQLELWAIKG